MTVICTWYGQYRQLRRRVREWSRLDCPVLLYNDGWPDTGLFAHIAGQAPNVTALSKLRDEGFCSHELRNWGMDACGTPWAAMFDLDCAMSPEFVAAFNRHDWYTAPRWMFRLSEPVTGYDPFPTDERGLTKCEVHPNCHAIPSSIHRYDARYFGQHTGDEQFFASLPPSYDVFPVPLTMEPRKLAG